MTIAFEAVLEKIDEYFLFKLPEDVSKQLPSRGMVMADGRINGIAIKIPLEPDGKGSHWFEVTKDLLKKGSFVENQVFSLEIEPTSDWSEPEIPDDIMEELMKEGLTDQWKSLTTKARWEWLRWIRSTQSPDTRKKRIQVACSKLHQNDRRPCCFDSTRCTVTDVAKSGVLRI